jgi:signal transduction histidine kinase
VLDTTEEQAHVAEVRLRRLGDANRAIVSELSLDGLLDRIVSMAQEISGAQYAALLVINEGQLEQFIHRGMDDATVVAIGRLPEVSGLLGALVEDPEPIRLHALSEDIRSSGFPPGHPPMGPYLGIPVRTANSVYGNLYLTKLVGQPGFSSEDENLVIALAATAGIAIENARLHEKAQRRQQWLRASAEVSQRLIAVTDELTMLHDIAGSLRVLIGADAVGIMLPAPDDPEHLVMEVVNGLGSDELQGLRFPAAGSQAHQVMQEERSIVLEEVQQRLGSIAELHSLPHIRHLVTFPLKGAGRPRGAILAGRLRDVPFGTDDLELADGFVSQMGLALELADSRSNHHRLTMLEDRARIAHDIHDQVVQKLFAAGLTIQGTVTMLANTTLRHRLIGVVDTLDDTIRTIRTSIFELQDPDLPGASVRARVMRVLGELTPVLGFAPLLSFEGPLDTMVDEQLGNEVEAVLRESLTNAAKHSEATAVTVSLATAVHTLVLTVSDNGVGLRPSARRSGLSNLRHRAESRGGRLELERAGEGGVLLRWTIPLPPLRTPGAISSG